MHDMFDLIINIIGTPCLGMNFVFTKIGSIHKILQLSHINLHFDFKNLLQSIYLIINVIFILLESIFYEFQSIFVNFQYIDDDAFSSTGTGLERTGSLGWTEEAGGQD